MIAFFILRDPFEDTQTVPENELALIQFPVQELFMRQLFKFDTVVFHNFDIRRFLRNAEFQRSFQKFLAGGKRIIVVGGEQVVGHRDYQELFLSGTSSQKLKLEFRHRTDWSFRERRLLPVHDLQHQPAFMGDLEEDYDQPSELLLRTPYRIDIMQPVYYTISSINDLFDISQMDIMSLVSKAKELGLHEPKFPPKEKLAS